MRRAGLLSFLLGSALARSAAADCETSAGCVDAEPLWLSPSAARFASVSDTAPVAPGRVAAAATIGFRYRPAVLTAPAPNRDGRDINLLRHTTDLSLAAGVGLGNRMELTLLLPAGLYQRGSGIKGITDQSGEAVPVASLHDPRLGFGFELVRSRVFGAKLRLEAKLPFGSRVALGGEESVVASPSVALSAARSGFFAGAELGLRLRRPAEFFGVRVGSQAALLTGVGYELSGPRLALALEAYVLPSLVDSGRHSYLPGEWLGTLRWAPRALAGSLGVGGGSALPISGDAAGSSVAFGVPAFRFLVFARYEP
ncbi:MAG: hypothetical protein EOO73_26000 [Myxococcales bacterium]|nr:MAG: hypothetical protein EOO73_26000 [Myxococcales bacterium]